jgi:GTPase SAR1 family protein
MFKIIIIGDPFGGKSSLMMKLALDKEPGEHVMTVGVDTKVKTVKTDDG